MHVVVFVGFGTTTYTIDDAALTALPADIEQASSAKADNYLKGWREGLAPVANQLLGIYVFLWGQKQERTPTWFGMFLADGSTTESVDVMHYLWNGAWPENRAPRIDGLQLDSKTKSRDVRLSAGEPYAASIVASDPDGDTLRFHWEIMRESTATQEGGDPERMPDQIEGLLVVAENHAPTVTAPAAPGAYRLFVYAYDGQGSAGHANRRSHRRTGIGATTLREELRVSRALAKKHRDRDELPRGANHN